MDARNITQRIVVLAVLTGGACLASTAYSNLIYTYGSPFNLSIPSPTASEAEYGRGWMDDAIINIPDHIIISDVDIAITVTHTNVFDLQLQLKSPAGNSCWLNFYNFDEFFIGANYTATVFDDEADLPIKQGHAPFVGRFRPRNPLDVFDNRDAFGTWRLRICDMHYYDTGTLESFELTITTTPEPATVLLLGLGAVLITLLKPIRRTTAHR